MDSNYKHAQPHARDMRGVHARACATCALIVMSMRCDVKNSQILAIFVEFPGAYDQALRVWGPECRGGKK